MKSQFIIKFKPANIVIFPILLILSFSITTLAQQSKLSLVDIFTALRSKKATMEQKNELLAEGVKQRGITFALSKSLQEELKKAGANDDLIEAIRLKNPPPPTPVVEKPKPTPKPVATPKPEPTPKPLDFAHYRNEGNSSYVLGNFDSAIKNYTEAIKLNDKESKIFFSRGLAYYNKERFTQAIEDFTKVIELDPKESMALYNRGNALKEMGKFEEALVDFKKAAEIDPENESAKEAFEKLQADLAPIKKETPQPVAKTQDEPEKKVEESNDKENSAKPAVNIGTLNALAKKLVSPVYPSIEKEIGVEGVVTVKVVINEKGKVIKAEAISGPKGLHKASEIAAKRSKFKPYKIDDVPVKATGYISYNFKK